MWQQFNALSQVDAGQEFQLMLTSNIRVGKTFPVSDFDNDMIVGARGAGLSVSEIADLLGFSGTTVSGVYSVGPEKHLGRREREN